MVKSRIAGDPHEPLFRELNRCDNRPEKSCERDDGKTWILGSVDGNPASSVFPGPGHQAIMPSKLGGWAAPALSNLGGGIICDALQLTTEPGREDDDPATGDPETAHSNSVLWGSRG